MDVSEIIEKLDEAEREALTAHIEALTGQRDQARKESIDGRKGLKAKIAELESAQSAVLERLGIDSVEELDDLPEPKGQAEAIKQFEARMKRMESELKQVAGERDAIAGKHRDAMLSANIEKALSSHEWIDRDVVSLLLKSGIEWDEDQPVYRHADQSLTIEEAAKTIATEKAHLLKTAGARGSGFTGHKQSGEGQSWTDIAKLKTTDPKAYRAAIAQKASSK